MRIVSFVGSKGGTFKTASSLNIAAVFAAAGLRVVLVDRDPQGSATKALPRPDAPIRKAGARTPGEQQAWQHPTVPNPLKVEAAVIDLPGIRAGNFRLAPAGALTRATASEVAANLVALAQTADLVVVDTPPYVSDIVEGIVAVSDIVLVPTDATAEGRNALPQVMLQVESIAVPPGRKRLLRTFLTGISGKGDAFVRGFRDDLADPEAYANEFYRVEIPRAALGAKANAKLRPSVIQQPNHAIAVAYRALALQIANDIGLPVPKLSALVNADRRAAKQKVKAAGTRAADRAQPTPAATVSAPARSAPARASRARPVEAFA